MRVHSDMSTRITISIRINRVEGTSIPATSATSKKVGKTLKTRAESIKLIPLMINRKNKESECEREREREEEERD